jgi:hypothetical protein
MSYHAIGRFIEEHVRGKPYVFVVMPYDDKYELFLQIQRIVGEAVGLKCIRADDVHGSGFNLLAKIHNLVDRAELVIAEISSHSQNVFYEVGYSVGIQKPLLLLAEEGAEIPTDLKGLEMIEYSGSKIAMEIFERHLHEHLRLRMSSQVSLLRDMLEADNPQPSYILASPKYPTKQSRSIGQVPDQRTFGDNLGIMGLTSAFGSFMGEGRGVELVSAQWYPDDLLRLPRNLYLIGSPKVNNATKIMLKKLQRGVEPDWFFGPAPGEKETGDYKMALYRMRKGKKLLVKGETRRIGPKKEVVHTVDHGIIVRGPHPDYPDRLVLIMAGNHSLGSGAACLAATRSPLIQQINDLLPPKKNIAKKDITFWALVRGEVSKRDSLLDMEDVKVVEAGVYDF